jgi:AcrR family transcriptional regulator
VAVSPTAAAVESPASARERLLLGLAASIRERGYRDTKISDIVAHARTSRRTFYEVFQDKEECFLALMHELNQQMQERIVAAVDPDAPWDEQIRAGVTAWIEAMGSRPELSVSWIREFPSLGPDAARGQQAAMRSITKMLEAMTNTPQIRDAGLGPVPRERVVILVGGLRELAAMVLEHGDPIESITEPAVEAAMSLLGPTAADPPPGRRGAAVPIRRERKQR